MPALNIETLNALVSPKSTVALSPSPVVVVGIYGVSGCGKSYLLKHLKTILPEKEFAFFEGSEVLDALVPGGLPAFKVLNAKEKYAQREQAIAHIHAQCIAEGKIGLVVGHLIFWDERAAGDACHLARECVWTARDAAVYSHIIYLDVPSADVVRRRSSDTTRKRGEVGEAHIRRWQDEEREQLRAICLSKQIVFGAAGAESVAELVFAIQRATESANVARAAQLLDASVEALATAASRSAMLVFDADKTLAPEDTGALFWSAVNQDGADPLKELFTSFGYTHDAFVQAAFLYGAIEDTTFEDICARVASRVAVHSEIVELVKEAKERGVGAIVLTCGLKVVWERVLVGAGLDGMVEVIGNGRIQDLDAVIVTPEVKRDMVARLQNIHGMYVCAFGDSPVDIPMLEVADEAVVVVGEDGKRSRSMDGALLDTLRSRNRPFRPKQWLLPADATPRLDQAILPLAERHAPAFVNSLLQSAALRRVLVAEANVAKLLMTPTRDARVSGRLLQKAHRAVGKSLALTLLPGVAGLGLEEFSIPHVQGTTTSGYRLHDEAKTLIVPLMRGGEPMAEGVFDILTGAMFVHAKNPEDLKDEHVQGRTTIILVDSVVNSGKSIEEFVEHIRVGHPQVRIVVVAGVVQAGSLRDGGKLGGLLAREENMSVVALRMSQNKFTGKRDTDTGNRLFGSTHLD
ncbi:Uracil phosphoribosyltransferase [Mycena kentingensis (nom. inval.)]|nr:Uracil phosphoribosyltransferase [Mycena kentingensis (nom. inval.)]